MWGLQVTEDQRTVPREPLAGRRAETSWLAGWWARATRGRAARALVLGVGGIGKTTLVDRFTAGLPDAVVVRVEADGDPAPGAFVTQVLAALDPAAPADPAAPSGSGADETAARALAAVGALQDRGPVVLVLHDVHDADEASSRALVRIARRLHHDRVLLVATARPEAAGGPWARLCADGPDGGTWTLQGLDEPGVRDVVRQLRPGRWSRATITRLHADTAGHPLHLTTLLRELPDEVLLDHAPLPAPRSLAEEVALAVGRLSPAARRLLSCLAVLDAPVGHRLLVRLDELAGVGIDAAARELTAAGLVDGLDLGARTSLRVHHPLVRSAVDALLEPADRSRLHLDAARAVGGSAALAHRVAATDGHPDPGLAVELEQAALAETVDGRQAATHLLAAADLSATGADAERRLLAACLRLIDTYDTDRLRSLLPAVRAGAPGPQRDVVLGFLLSLDNDPAALVHLQTAVDDPAAPGEVRALAGVRLALENVVRGRGAAADEVAARVPDLTASPARAEQALIMQAVGRALHRGPDAGLALLDGHIEGAVTADPAITAGTLLLGAGHVAPARARLEEGLARVRRGAVSTSTHRAHCHLVEALFRTGRWDLADAEADIALGWFADGDRSWAEATAHAVAALVPAARGEQDRAGAHLDAARTALARTTTPQGVLAVALADATLARALDDGARAERALRALPQVAARGGYASAPFAPWRPRHAEALVATGDLAGARRAVRSWPPSGAPVWFRLARQQVQARIALAAGDPAGAETALRAGVGLAETHGVEIADECPVELAELRVLLGELPHVSDGPAQLAAARPVFARLAAGPWSDRIEAASADPESRAGEHHTLTPRERQVASLVAQGMTSREAADLLWVTPKAVDYHLGNVYAKLGIASRRQLRGRSFS